MSDTTGATRPDPSAPPPEPVPAGPGTPGRAWKATKAGAASAFRTVLFLVSIMVPVSLAVSLLNWSGALPWAAGYLAPVMKLLGLPGEAALAFVSSVFLNIYSAIAAMETLSLTARETTILAVMCLTAHNMIVETTVMKKTGSSALKMIILRLGMAVLAAWVINLLLPVRDAGRVVAAATASGAPLVDVLRAWGLSTARLVLKVVVLVSAIMVGQKLLEEFKVTEFLSKLFAPLMKVFGLSDSSSFLWIIINVVGYAYGAAVIMDRVKDGKMKRQDADLFNHHAALCHSLLEDTALFLAIGVSLFWLVVPRLLMALFVVWFERIRRRRFRNSLRVGRA